MRLRFTKMTGAGNDFVMIDAISQRADLSTAQVRKLADRHFGVGCDQVLIVEAPTSPDVDFRYRIFNHDGSEVENCGNGARCFALFVRQRRLTGKKRICVETKGGNLVLQVLPDNQVKVNMGVPTFEPADIPFTADQRAEAYPLNVNGQTLSVHCAGVGNPHAVTLVENVDNAQVDTLGPLIEAHKRFPNRVNVGFLQIVDRNSARLRVFERGVGETLACGTGACAAAVLGMQQGLFNASVEIHLPGGVLTIEWAGEGEPIYMTGPATTIYQGQITLR